MRKGAFTLVEIMIVIMLIAILIMIAVPEFAKARFYSQRSACLENQRELDEATAMWAMETGAIGPSVPSMGDLVPAYIKSIPACPTNGVYTLTDQTAPSTCSIHPRVIGKGKDKDKDKGNGNG